MSLSQDPVRIDASVTNLNTYTQAQVIRQGARVNHDLDGAITPLCICAARGLVSCVKFLLREGSVPDTKGRGRFRLWGSRRTIKGIFSPLEWTDRMLEAEEAAAVAEEDLVPLRRCRKLLSAATT